MYIRYFLFNLDDRVKVWIAVSTGGSAIYCVDPYLQAAMLGICLTLCLYCGARRFVAGFIIAVAALAVTTAIFACLPCLEGKTTGRGIFYILLKFGPMFAMMVFLQASLNTSRFLRSLECMRMPPQWVIPLGVCLRFMPSVAAECRQIRYAMRIRGVGLTPKRLVRRPFESVGYMLVPLLVRSLAIGDELARAAVARGIETPGAKTSLYDLGFCTKDAVVLAVWTMVLIILVVADHQIYAAIVGRMP
ncbi:putative cobalt import, permease protein [Desulfosarcina variabilis str. Montpellier]|uniref:energy-coupling factor transporter transmembrane component T n=1 Tax=Desulfosarcina variabilis TaxID=2300 RepID=UPI003AFA210A